MDLRPLHPDAISLSIDQDTLIAQGLRLLDPGPIERHVNARFDMAAGLFDDLLFLQASHKIIRAASRPLEIFDSPELDRVGIDFLRVDMANPRLTTSAAMTWAGEARRNVVDTTTGQCDDYLHRRGITLNHEQLQRCTGRGFVLIRHRGFGLGVGFLESTRSQDANVGQVRSMYPRAYCVDLNDTSAFGNPDE